MLLILNCEVSPLKICLKFIVITWKYFQTLTKMIYMPDFNPVTCAAVVLLGYQSEMGLKAQRSINAFWKMNSRIGYSVQLGNEGAYLVNATPASPFLMSKGANSS